MTTVAAGHASAAASGAVLLTLGSAQFLMTLDSSVMNVSISTVARDVDTSVTGIQTAITLYTLVMASLMVTGGRLGEIWGRRRVFEVGCVVYGAGSFTTALAPDLGWLILGWSVLEGIGAALIMPAIVALVATNFPRSQRPRAYGLVAASGAVAVAVGPLIGGLLTTYASWRWVFAGEVLIVLVILRRARRLSAEPPARDARLDPLGTLLSSVGLGAVVLGILRAGAWGFVNPKPGAPAWLGLSPSIWLVAAGGVVLRLFVGWERRRLRRAEAVLVDPALLGNQRLRSGLTSFFTQYLLQAGIFFVVPLFLSVALGLSAVATGLRILPLSATLLLGAVGIPKLFPQASPRRVVRIGYLLLLLGIASLVGALEQGAGPDVVTGPLLLAGLGIGALASQLGSVTVSAVPDERSGEVGGLQNTLSYLGASLGTALAGAVLIAGLSTSFLTGIENNPDVPDSVANRAAVELAGGVPFISDDQLAGALEEAGVDAATARAVEDENESARVDALRSALAVLGLVALMALFLAGRLPTRQPGSEELTAAGPG